MNGWLLDTNVLIDLIFGTSATLSARYVIQQQARSPLFLSSISLFEFRYGAERSYRRDFQLEALRRFLATAAVLDFDDHDAQHAALLKRVLAGQGTPIGAYDVLIAAQAQARGLSVATGNTREFSRVPDLVVEDWTLPA